MSLPVLSTAQAQLWDSRTAAAGLPVVALMESAGRGAAAVITARFASAVRQGTLVAVGPGNNGGDGWVLARALHALGLPVWVVATGGNASELNRLNAQLAHEAGVRTVDPDGPWPAVGLIVDAILGAGAKGRPRPAVATLVARIAELDVPGVALDGPTGLDLDTGVSHESLPVALTITFGGYRRGHLLARDDVGDLVVIDLGFSPALPEWPRFLRDRDAARAVARFAASSHKGTRGRVVILGGAVGMTGAARLAARAAFAAGAGLVHVIAPEESIARLAAAEPDVQTAVSSFDELSDEAAKLLGSAAAVVIGPGLGRTAKRAAFIEAAMAAFDAPCVLDADGLMAFAGSPGSIAGLVRGRPVVLTPHAGEYRALFPASASDLGVDPWRAAGLAAEASGATVLLKGVPTVVAGSAGAPWTVAAGNPGLATGGSGDTLCGIIATLLAQGVEPMLAAAAAAQAAGQAADLAARRATARAVRPMDVIGCLPDVWRRWDRDRREPPAAVAPVLHELASPQNP